MVPFASPLFSHSLVFLSAGCGCRYKAQVFIDECHATGFFGATGKGTPEHTGTEGRIDVRVQTMPFDLLLCVYVSLYDAALVPVSVRMPLEPCCRWRCVFLYFPDHQLDAGKGNGRRHRRLHCRFARI